MNKSPLVAKVADKERTGSSGSWRQGSDDWFWYFRG